MNLTLTTSFKHQVTAINLSKDRPYFALFMEQGTGKSHVIIATWTHLFRQGELDGVLLLAPSGVQHMWERNEIPIHSPLNHEELQICCWHNGMPKRQQNIWSYHTENHNPKQLLVLCANIEAIRTEPFRKSITKFVNQRKWMFVIDESTTVKNHKSDQAKECFKIAAFAKYTRILTGTPITQSPLDLFSQCRILSRAALPYDSWTTFKAEFANEIQQRFGHRSFAKILNYKNEDKLAQIVGSFSYRVLKADCLDLPPKVYNTRYVELTAEQKRIYNELVTTSLATLANAEFVLVTTVLALLTRLHQVTMGYVPNEDKELVQIPHNRGPVLRELLEQTPTKAIIFCRFMEDIRQVEKVLLEIGDPHSYVKYTGEETAENKTNAVDQFQNRPTCRYFLATKAAARGLTLTAAEQVVYYSQDYSLEARLQSEDRAHRSGQTKSVVYTDLVARGTVEEKIIAALQGKKELAASVMGKDAFQQLITLKEE